MLWGFFLCRTLHLTIKYYNFKRDLFLARELAFDALTARSPLVCMLMPILRSTRTVFRFIQSFAHEFRECFACSI